MVFCRSYLPGIPINQSTLSFTGDKQAFDRARDFLENRSIPVFVPWKISLRTLQVLCRCREALNQP